MQLRRKLKRLAAIALSLVMMLSCMPAGVLAEAATPTVLIPENTEVATPDEAAPEEHPHDGIPEGVPTETEMEVVPDLPATEEIPSEAAPESGDDVPLPEEQDASCTPTGPETPNGEESTTDSRLPIQAALDEYGHVYVATVRQTSVYGEPDLKPESLVYTTTEDIFLVLATEFQAPASVKAWFLNEAGEVVSGYVHADDLDDSYLLDEDISEINFLPSDEGMTLLGLMPLFLVSGFAPQADNSLPETADPTLPNEAEPTEQPEDTEIVHEQPTLEPEDVASVVSTPGNPRCMEAPAKTAHTRRSPNQRRTERSMPRRIIWRATPSTVWNTTSPAPEKAPARIRAPKARMCWWIWMPS